MASDKDYFFKIYAAETLDDEDFEDLPLEAQAIVFRMWCVLCRRGRMKATAAEIARLCLLKPDAMESLHLHLQNILQMFCTDADGMLYSERLEREREKSGRVSKVRSAAAKKSHQSRNKELPANADANAPANALQNGLQNSCIHSYSYSQSNPPKPPLETPASLSPENPDELIWEVAKLHPRNDRLKQPHELPSNQRSILAERIETDGDDVRQGTELFRKKWESISEKQRGFLDGNLKDPFRFWKSFAYRELLDQAKAEAEKPKPMTALEAMERYV